MSVPLQLLLTYRQPILKQSGSRKEVLIMAGKKGEVTSPKVASKAAKLLANPKTPPAVKSVAGSALTQAANKPKGKK